MSRQPAGILTSNTDARRLLNRAAARSAARSGHQGSEGNKTRNIARSGILLFLLHLFILILNTFIYVYFSFSFLGCFSHQFLLLFYFLVLWFQIGDIEF